MSKGGSDISWGKVGGRVGGGGGNPGAIVPQPRLRAGRGAGDAG